MRKKKRWRSVVEGKGMERIRGGHVRSLKRLSEREMGRLEEQGGRVGDGGETKQWESERMSRRRNGEKEGRRRNWKSRANEVFKHEWKKFGESGIGGRDQQGEVAGKGKQFFMGCGERKER